jgi:peptidoglycan/xylan/chitin deacetylase (PgdA/CDA1 family)
MIQRALAGVRQLGRWARSRVVGRGLVLLYHRVWDSAQEIVPDVFSLCVTPRHFTEHLQLIQESYTPISLQAMVKGIQERDLPPRAVAITFDDGYADNLSHAKPLLEEYEIPATIFVISGSLGKDFWWDQLTALVFQPHQLPDYLRLEINDHTFTASLQTRPEMERKSLLKGLHRFLRDLTPAEKATAISRLTQWSGYQPPQNRSSRPLTPTELAKLTETGLIEIGSHSVSHQALRTLPLTEQETEINQSKWDLEGILGRPVASFSYPFGLHRDYSHASVELVRHAGFDNACTNEVDTVWFGSDPHELPRYWVRDLPAGQLDGQIRRWLSP